MRADATAKVCRRAIRKDHPEAMFRSRGTCSWMPCPGFFSGTAGRTVTRLDLTRRLAQLRTLAEVGELSEQEARWMRRAAALAYSLEQPARRAARRRIRSEVEAGRLERPPNCSRCGAPGAEAHHPDHAFPLAVIWVCPACHLLADAELARLPVGVSA